jgi:serine/threonine protein kinase/Tol biopolymer transport system component
MPLQSGTRLGSYELLSLLGEGGMGEVYRARDLELRRDVAIKVLPASVASDPERLARLRREAQVLAALNHPHIAQIYGIASEGDVRGLVLELVDGETLADRLARERHAGLPVAEALPIARDIAAALDAAHAKGIVHRDLKPANIKITTEGVVKILDFGIATIVAPDPTGEPVGPKALTQLAEEPGVVAGTAAYMSPEQARGAAVDRRADSWAFGCVVYEMLTGRPAFDGPTETDTLAATLSRAPDWTTLPGDTPAEIRRLLERCLQKDAAQRFRDLGDARFVIEDAATVAESHAAAPKVERRSRWLMPVGVVAVAVLIGAGAFAAYSRMRAPAAPPVIRMSIASPGAVTPQLSAAISPDGRNVAFVSTDSSGQSLLWVRTLESLEALALPGTEHAAHPFWSPDSRSIGFFADSKVKRVPSAGGPVQVLADAVRYGYAWSPDGATILFNLPGTGALATVPAAGGPVREVPAADPPLFGRIWQRFLPDSRHFIFFGASADERGIYVGSLDSPETKLLLHSDFGAWYTPPGYLVFPRDETLMAQPFDAVRLELHGEPEPIADGIWFARTAARSSYSVTENALAYVNASLWDAQLLWYDRTGRPLGPAAPVVRNEGRTPAISPDGRSIAIGRGELGREDIWVLGTSGGAPVRLTFTPEEGDWDPVWSADGRHVMYAAKSRAGMRLLTKDVGTGEEQVLVEAKPSFLLLDWSRDGRYVLLGLNNRIWVTRVDAEDRSPALFENTTFNEAQAQLSPNVQWVAYTSNATGRDEVYVDSFPTPGRKRQVSSGGGAMPRWRADGHELFYLAGDQFLMSLPIKDEGTLDLGTPERLFRTRIIVQGSESGYLPTYYDVSPDGSRFLVRYPPEDPGPPITVVLNWQSALKH